MSMTLKALKAVIDKHDPMGLLEMGAPSDEYGPEVRSISSGLSHCRNLKEVEAAIGGTFDFYFGVNWVSQLMIEKIAHEIYC